MDIKNIRSALVGRQSNSIIFIQIPSLGVTELAAADSPSDAYFFDGKLVGGTGVIKATSGIARIEVTCADEQQIRDNEAIWAPWDIVDASSQIKLFSFPPISAIRLVVDSGTARVQITGR